MVVNELKKKWVVSISGRRLQGNEISLLRKGLHFAITPHTVPTKDILSSVEAAIYHLARENLDATRAEVYGALKHAKQRNLPNKEWRALKERKSDKNVIIITADKGNCIVVMKRTDYRNQIQEMLQNQNGYAPITDKRHNTTARTELQLQRKLLGWKKVGNLNETVYCSSAPPTPHQHRFTVYQRYIKWNCSTWTTVSLSWKAQKREYH
ncbi:uncharacterized protein [Montipora capricornis]|uniref:uncharacterized protein n=1 Tax=Montipora capricornis TaxID=246305 RepID=UPI0035F1BE30